MSALSDLTTSSSSKTTTLPSWYTDAQRSAVDMATSGVNSMPSIGDTVAGKAISNLSGANNPFDKATGYLSTIASGAANPWLVDASGNVTPNTNTALGGLFSAQNQQLKTLLPQYEAPATGGAIAGGGFGSLRGQTAANTAVTNAQADLFSKQMQAALQNQQTGVNAATGMGNVGEQGTKAEVDLGKIQQADTLAKPAALATLLSNIKVPESVAETKSLSPLETAGALGTAYSKLPTTITGPLSNVFGKIFGEAGSILNDIFSGSDTSGSDYMPGVDQFDSVWGP